MITEKIVLLVPVEISYKKGRRSRAVELAKEDIEDYSHLSGGISDDRHGVAAQLDGEIRVERKSK